MNRTLFFDHIRHMFNGTLSLQQVDGTDAIIESCERNGVTNVEHVAHILAHVKRETGGYMLGIKETVMPHHQNKDPSDAEVIRRLDSAWTKGQLKGVKAPYWRTGEFGRGPIQVTHFANRKKFAKRLGVPIDKNASLLLDRNIGADTAVVGMKEGLFRGPKLSDYDFPADLSNPPNTNPRRIVNGKDGSDAEVAASHRKFAAALRAAGYGAPQKPVQIEEPRHATPVAPEPALPEPDDAKPKNTPISPASRTAQGTVTAGASGLVVAGSAATEMASKLQEANTQISGGTWLLIAAGILTMIGAAYAFYARWRDGGGLFPWERK